MTQAIIIREYGGAEVLRCEETELPPPGAGQLRIVQSAVGVNYHDVYVRSGLYKTLALPGTPGCEATGTVQDIGAGVEGFKKGDRIAYVTGTYGAYASARNLPADLAVPIPHSLRDETVAANLLRAMTVAVLAEKVQKITPGMHVLIHAAAGGVGRMLCQIAAHKGATVIGTVGSPAKADTARAYGCHHPILYREADFVQAVQEITQGQGVDIVYDSVGADTFAGSLETLSLCGHLVNFGQSSGPVAPLEMSTLAAKSLTVTRPILFHYMSGRMAYQGLAKQVFDWFEQGILVAEAPMPIPLKHARKAHETLESMIGGGALILVP